jgi:hypothetical protein
MVKRFLLAEPLYSSGVGGLVLQNNDVSTKYNLDLHTGTHGTNGLKKLVTVHVFASSGCMTPEQSLLNSA